MNHPVSSRGPTRALGPPPMQSCGRVATKQGLDHASCNGWRSGTSSTCDRSATSKAGSALDQTNAGARAARDEAKEAAPFSRATCHVRPKRRTQTTSATASWPARPFMTRPPLLKP